jgi:4-alpha-glucanotransferase
VKTVNVKFSAVVPDLSGRSSGVLCHVTSLPGPYGIGDLGPAGRQWIDLLADAGQRWWQMLPLGPTDEGNSPYRCYSAFAGNPLLISPDLLFEDGLLSRSALAELRLPPGKVNYPKVIRNKMSCLGSAHKRFLEGNANQLSADYQQFVSDEPSWLGDFALFAALRQTRPEQSWTDWPRPLLRRDATALKTAIAEHRDAIRFHQFVQFLFFRQLRSLHDHARAAGVALIGDLPIFVSPESADVWTNPRLFQLDRHLRPSAVSGVPPDLFSATGQRWGNPLYDWKQMAQDHFSWWKARMKSAMNQADLVRIDHFRGFESYWRIPCDAPTAQSGKWVNAPGKEFFNAMLGHKAALPLLAEDLGIITPEVEALRDRFNLPGMRVLQFGFTDEPGNPHTPHNFIRHCFGYTGTHDNDTTAGWFASLPPAMRRRLKQYAPRADWSHEPVWSMIGLLMGSTAGHAIIPLQDLLELGSSARMNTPAVCDGNWQWRLRSFADCPKPFHRLAKMTEVYERGNRAAGGNSDRLE